MSDDEMKDGLDEVEPDLDPKKIPGLLADEEEEEDGDFDPEDLGIEEDVNDL